ncbi:hypothetical protein NCC49_004234 [Naganishia albida]|nr:hypothetical protein NCC49_004234 [Naganishia albida]
MSFVNPASISQDITSSAFETTGLFSLDSTAFPGATSDDFERDLEKQQQHHLAQFLYFQGLALQRQAFLASNDNTGAVDNLFNNVGTSPDTLYSESLEDQLHDFVTAESISDSSVSAPSTPDLLGTNINSLSYGNIHVKDLACSPDASQARSDSVLSMSDKLSPQTDPGNTAQTGFGNQDNGFQATNLSRHPSNDQINMLAEVTVNPQYSWQRGEDVRVQPFMFNLTSNMASVPSLHAQAYARNRSSSIAVPYLNAFPQAMSNGYISGHSAPYQPYVVQAVHAAGLYDGSSAMPTDIGQHQRTFSLPNNHVSMAAYGDSGLSMPEYRRDQAFGGGNVLPMDLQRAGSIGPQRQEANPSRPTPYDRVSSSSSRSSFSGHRVGIANVIRTSADSAAASPLPVLPRKESSSGSSTPGATVIPENLKDVPVNMIRNPHGGGRGYVPGETPEDPKKKHKCGICGRGFARLYNLKSHASTHDPARPKPYECPHEKCTRSFSRLHDLERHRQGIHRDGPLMDAKEQGITPSVARAQNRIEQRDAVGGST